jgi:hypothetical protein
VAVILKKSAIALTALGIIVAILVWSAPAQGPELLVVSTQEAYWRYEVAEFFADGVDPTVTELVGLPLLDGEAVPGVSGREEVPFKPLGDGRWRACWAMPWDPELGGYELRVEGRDAAGAVVQTTTVPFQLRGRAPSTRVKLPHFALTLETDADYFTAGLQGPRLRVPGWKNVIAWAEYAGADSFWFGAALTKAVYNPTAENPWYQPNVDLTPLLAREAHRAGLEFGAWLSAFFPYGARRPAIDYDYSRNYVFPETDDGAASPEGEFWWTLNASLNCELRKSHLIAMARRLEAEPQVDYIGLDYIRTGPGGYELVSDFARELNLVPWEGFLEAPLEEQMTWLVGQLRGRNRAMINLWQWWRASKAARTLKEVKDEAGVTKPFWCFTLGWEMGHQHGQDILMMTDAGADFCAVMMYDASRNEWDGMTTDWREAYRDGRGNVVAGVIADPPQLENPYNPRAPYPLEMGNRAAEAAFELARDNGPWDDLPEPESYAELRADGLTEGLFLHDLERMAYRNGGWWLADYIIAGAAAMSELRAATGDCPITLEVHRPQPIGAFLFELPVDVTNISDQTVTNLEVRSEPTRYSSVTKGGTIEISELAPGQTVSVRPRWYAYEYTAEHDPAAGAVWGGRSPRERAFAIRYQLPWVVEEEETTPTAP